MTKTPPEFTDIVIGLARSLIEESGYLIAFGVLDIAPGKISFVNPCKKPNENDIERIMREALDDSKCRRYAFIYEAKLIAGIVPNTNRIIRIVIATRGQPPRVYDLPRLDDHTLGEPQSGYDDDSYARFFFPPIN